MKMFLSFPYMEKSIFKIFMTFINHPLISFDLVVSNALQQKLKATLDEHKCVELNKMTITSPKLHYKSPMRY